ncbi:MAG: RING finger protein [Candidatus Helarchaeales archaeon]
MDLLNELKTDDPARLIQRIVEEDKKVRKKDHISFEQVLHTYIFDTPIKAEIYESDAPNASKIVGTVQWIGDRKDEENGVELFIKTRTEKRNVLLGIKNTQEFEYDPVKRSFKVIQAALKCPICKNIITSRQETIKCPNCNVVAHRDEFLEYLKVNGVCPSCGAKLSLKGKAS